MKFILWILVTLSALTSKAEKFNLDIKNLCEMVPNKYFLIQSVLTLNSKEKKLYQIQCTSKNMKCVGVSLNLNGTDVTANSLVPQIFDATNINLTENTATFIYNNVTFTADKKENKVRMIVNVVKPDSSAIKSSEEYWVGSCK